MYSINISCILCRTLHSGPDSGSTDTSTDQVPYHQPQQQPGLDYSLQRRDNSMASAYSHGHIISAPGTMQTTG